MRLQIRHTTIFHYSEAINEAYTEMRLRPLEGAGQRCYRFSLVTEPRGEVMSYIDRYGNTVHHFDTLQSHDRVVVMAASDVETSSTFHSEPTHFSPLDAYDFLAPTEYAPLVEEIGSFARSHAVADDPEASAFGLMEGLYRELVYDPNATDVKTRAPEALRLKRGVCQDFAHLMLASCRMLAIPARYVSGYLYSLRTVSDTVSPDNAASHAWVDVYLAHRGWVSLDPTHNCEQTEEYVRVATGRDYADVPPTRGIYKGGASERLEVQVEVKAVSI
jgi:transglutaminase-like putative cysteine protease